MQLPAGYQQANWRAWHDRSRNKKRADGRVHCGLRKASLGLGYQQIDTGFYLGVRQRGGATLRGHCLEALDGVVIKRCHALCHARRPSGLVTRFRREGQALAALEHRHIAGVLDTDTANGMHYLVMTYLPGGTLGALLKRTQDAGEVLPIDKALDIIRQIASALEYAHSKGIIHRDLKPGNVLIAEDGRFVLSDFGLAQAQASTRLTRTSTIMGTAEYMSPEQALGKELDHRSDIYSLGVILYELLALIDAMRMGRPREAELAKKIFSQRLQAI